MLPPFSPSFYFPPFHPFPLSLPLTLFYSLSLHSSITLIAENMSLQFWLNDIGSLFFLEFNLRLCWLQLKFTYSLPSPPSVPAGSSLPALPGLCLAAAVPVSLSLPADRWLPVGLARQHPPATLLQLPGQLPARAMQTLPGTRHLRGALPPDYRTKKGLKDFPVKCIDYNNDQATLLCHYYSRTLNSDTLFHF